MKYTGERYQTDLNLAEISYEHWHRYFYATQFVKDKQVLDIACGEGYGANLMAQTAKTVVGVDISQEAIDFAKERYPRGNLSFLQGSVEKIPIDGVKKFDVVVSFETIEHVDAGMQESFLKEVRRLLKDDGVLVISSPNKLFYSDITGRKNKFHLKEFYEKEFVEFLRKYFGQVTLLGQKVFTGSDMWKLDNSSRAGLFVEYQITNEGQRFIANDDKKEAVYLVAVCSDSKIEAVENSFLVDNSLSILSERDLQIYERDVKIAIISQVVAERDVQITGLNQDVNAILASWSWKLTAPLRWIAGRLRIIRGQMNRIQK
jgi:O-antigen biosynthesis protein